MFLSTIILFKNGKLYTSCGYSQSRYSKGVNREDFPPDPSFFSILSLRQANFLKITMKIVRYLVKIGTLYQPSSPKNIQILELLYTYYIIFIRTQTYNAQIYTNGFDFIKNN